MVPEFNSVVDINGFVIRMVSTWILMECVKLMRFITYGVHVDFNGMCIYLFRTQNRPKHMFDKIVLILDYFGRDHTSYSIFILPYFFYHISSTI